MWHDSIILCWRSVLTYLFHVYRFYSWYPLSQLQCLKIKRNGSFFTPFHPHIRITVIVSGNMHVAVHFSHPISWQSIHTIKQEQQISSVINHMTLFSYYFLLKLVGIISWFAFPATFWLSSAFRLYPEIIVLPSFLTSLLSLLRRE